MMPPLYLLDTNILIHFVRSSSFWEQIRDRYNLFAISPTPVISIVSEGELRSLALQWKWGKRKLDQLEFGLDHLQKQSIAHPIILRAYANLDFYCESVGRSLGKNDLWIAATALFTGATLLTTDRDFDHLSPQFLARDWIDPNTP